MSDVMEEKARTESVAQTARSLGICRDTVYDLIKAGELDSFHIGKSHRITTRSIDAFIERRLIEERKKGRAA